MRKIIVSIGVVMLVAVLPAGSWYYLQTGLNYRKEALDKLQPKGAFALDMVTQAAMTKSKTVLYQLKSDVEVSDKIFEQYQKAETFLMFTKEEGNGRNKLKLDKQSLDRLNLSYPESAFILIDTSNQIRNVYNGSPMETAKEVVSHISIVLPRKKDKDIKMKKNR